ncbi:hypothetical protein DFJ77DRAFT_308048 [Powellomyces hirtus]|nr:hypothetical protein DFJ77DRAFT_308048 [Powellomyces hirtus]
MEYLSPAPVPFSPFGVGVVAPPPGFANMLPNLPPLLFNNNNNNSSSSSGPSAVSQDPPATALAPAANDRTNNHLQPQLRSNPSAQADTGTPAADPMPAQQRQKGVSFREYVTVAYTWGADEYDRTSTDVEPLTKNDLIELLLYRAEMQHYTRELLKLRKQAFEAERRYARQREIAAIQAYQRCSIAAAAQFAAQSAYTWDHAAAVAAAAAGHHGADFGAYQHHSYYPLHARSRGYVGSGGGGAGGNVAYGGNMYY